MEKGSGGESLFESLERAMDMLRMFGVMNETAGPETNGNDMMTLMVKLIELRRLMTRYGEKMARLGVDSGDPGWRVGLLKAVREQLPREGRERADFCIRLLELKDAIDRMKEV